MTGPEHYQAAERLLKDKHRDDSTVAEAQVHATLALAAATALGARMGFGLGNDAGQAWDSVTAPAKRGGRS